MSDEAGGTDEADGVPVRCYYVTSRAHHRLIAAVGEGAGVDLKALAAALGWPRLSLGGEKTLRGELGTGSRRLSPLVLLDPQDASIAFVLDAALGASARLALPCGDAPAMCMTPADLVAALRARRVAVHILACAAARHTARAGGRGDLPER